MYVRSTMISSGSVTYDLILGDYEVTLTMQGSLENRRGWVAGGLILINIKRDWETWGRFRENFVFMMDSLLSYTPSTNIHFIVITDEWTRDGEPINQT